ncbi:MAG: hypothetical protein M3Y54_14260 [Bacteroidota bacterium]|nr:hypothetical protein [Bacteroidota bacterium]
MLLIVTVPLAMLLLNLFAVAVSQGIYRMLKRMYPEWCLADVDTGRLLWQTFVCQIVGLPLFFVLAALVRSGMALDELALHLLLLSPFFTPPILLWWKRHWAART